MILREPSVSPSTYKHFGSVRREGIWHLPGHTQQSAGLTLQKSIDFTYLFYYGVNLFRYNNAD